MACLSYRVYLHDPTYHYLVKNPLVSPRIFRQYKDLTANGGTYEWLYITATEKKNLNRESQPWERRAPSLEPVETGHRQTENGKHVSGERAGRDNAFRRGW